MRTASVVDFIGGNGTFRERVQLFRAGINGSPLDQLTVDMTLGLMLARHVRYFGYHVLTGDEGSPIDLELLQNALQRVIASLVAIEESLADDVLAEAAPGVVGQTYALRTVLEWGLAESLDLRLFDPAIYLKGIAENNVRLDRSPENSERAIKQAFRAILMGTDAPKALALLARIANRNWPEEGLIIPGEFTSGDVGNFSLLMVRTVSELPLRPFLEPVFMAALGHLNEPGPPPHTLPNDNYPKRYFLKYGTSMEHLRRLISTLGPGILALSNPQRQSLAAA